jgi:hypothetical protein
MVYKMQTRAATMRATFCFQPQATSSDFVPFFSTASTVFHSFLGTLTLAVVHSFSLRSLYIFQAIHYSPIRTIDN